MHILNYNELVEKDELRYTRHRTGFSGSVPFLCYSNQNVRRIFTSVKFIFVRISDIIIEITHLSRAYIDKSTMVTRHC